MSQKKYTADILQKLDNLKSKTSLIPMDQYHDLLHNSDSPLLHNAAAYRRLVGKLIYLTISRPDLSYAVHIVAQYMHSPRAIHLHVVLKLVRYLVTTASQGLFYAAKTNLVLVGFWDADWGGCKLTRQSLTGYCYTFGGTLIA
ncbi:putative mitochondrial protein AtMg00240 [Apium graveolens]|uniref:putative mitochondrial protein AtMg00240 n=1 Tax=Apium graveolens TaxID=4045 RepID=UPI003D7A630A